MDEIGFRATQLVHANLLCFVVVLSEVKLKTRTNPFDLKHFPPGFNCFLDESGILVFLFKIAETSLS